MKLNREICEQHIEILREANQQWFYGYNYEVVDHVKLVEAIKFFENIVIQQRDKLIKEGKL